MNEAVRERDGTAIKDKEPAVFLHAIERRYHQGAGTLEILKGAELAVWSGQSVALIAPSGVGKSTLLHIAGLLEHPDGGEVYVDGTATSTVISVPPLPSGAVIACTSTSFMYLA